MLVLTVLIGLLLWNGGHAAPRVREFTWQDKQVGAEDTAFILNFSRPMDHASVESNLWINPPLPGKVSWAGRRMAYTLDMSAPYGTLFQIELQRSRDRFTKADSPRATLQPFTGRFRSRDRAFAYIGVEGEEDGRLVLYNLTQQKKQVLTPKDLVLNEFKPYPLGDRILFSATPRTAQPRGILEQQLYTVTTGIHIQPPVQVNDPDLGNSPVTLSSEPAGTIKLVLDNQAYQTLKFDLSADGKLIVVQRVNRKDPADFGPWILRQGEPPQPLKGNPGGDFLIAPDSNSLAISQGQGLAILPLQPDAKPLDFLPRFGMILSFSRDGTEAAVIKFNSDRTRSLFLVNSQGKETELLKTPGSILTAQFDPMKQTLYCLLTELVTEGDLYQEHPYLAAIDLKTKKLTPLLLLPNQREVQISLSPDGLAFLFDQTEHSEAQNPTTDKPIQTQQGKAISTSRLWLFPIDPLNPTAQSQPEALPMAGLHPRWLP
jgi:dipeptidyl aminopeptidase/acylaminoacyl peptidase